MGHRPEFSSRLITDSQVLSVLHELYEQERRLDWGTYRHHPDPHQHPGTGFSLSPEQGDQLYLLLRYARAVNVVEFATSLGFSTLFLAAALKENGGGDGPYRGDRAGEGAAGPGEHRPSRSERLCDLLRR